LLSGPQQLASGEQSHWFSADGRAVLTIVDAVVYVSDAQTGKQLSPPLRHPEPVTHACFSPDGKLVLTGCADKNARVWDVATGQPVMPPLRHTTRVLTGSFSRDGRGVLTV